MAYDIENIFTYHAPSEVQQAKYVAIRQYAKTMAEIYLELCPDSRERSLALTKIEESVMWANASVARCENG